MPIIKAYLDTPLGQLHYASSTPPAASSYPLPVLLLHMSASSSQSFHSMMHTLSNLGYACYAPDMPGFGSSFDPPVDPPSIAWYADLYHHALLTNLPGIFQSGCHVVGHHSGGIIGTELAAKYPGFCRSLTMIGPTIMSAEDRLAMSKTFLDPFNKPVASGNHLQDTWEYLQFEGLMPEKHEDLMQREVIDHIRAWKGRWQIYSCVWEYDMKDVLVTVDKSCVILGLCARDDVLWPYFGNFVALGERVMAKEIEGGNFGPDLDGENIVKLFVDMISAEKK